MSQKTANRLLREANGHIKLIIHRKPTALPLHLRDDLTEIAVTISSHDVEDELANLNDFDDDSVEETGSEL